jgi:putative MATE family efflux protein
MSGIAASGVASARVSRVGVALRSRRGVDGCQAASHVTAARRSLASTRPSVRGVVPGAASSGEVVLYSFGDGDAKRTETTTSVAVDAEATESDGEGNAGAKNKTFASYWADAMPANDALDKQIMKLFVPAMLNFLIIPFVGAVDVFWVGRMGSTVALAAQGAANQVFQSAFWIISFVPSIIAPVVAKAAASGDTKEVQRATGEAIFVASLVGVFGMVLLTVFQAASLQVVGVVPGSETAAAAAPYIGWRALTFVPAIVSTVGFAAFRGTLDVTTPMKITLVSQMVNLLLDPILIFGGGAVKAMGVAGAAIATSASEVTSFTLYIRAMMKKGIITLGSLIAVPSWGNIGKLMVGGAAVQMRSIAQNITFLAVMRAILQMDATRTAAAAHTVSAQMFQLCLIAVLALSTLASILIPQKLNAAKGEGGQAQAKVCADRLLVWGFLLGTFLACVQLCLLPGLKFFTPLENVQAMARGPVMIGAMQMPLNGLVFVAEGLMQGHQAFARLAGGMCVSTALMLGALKVWGSTVEGVWGCFFVFNISRLAFGLRHHFFDGPLAPSKLRAAAAAAEETKKSD